MKRILHSLLVLARDAFPYTLIFYLVLFLLENLFPGFVSNNFSLNLVLAAVLINGVLAACAPEPQKKEPEKPAGKNDYLLVAVLGLIGGAVIFAKMGAGSLRWATAAVSSVLIVLMGLVSLSPEEEAPEVFDQASSDNQEGTVPNVHWRSVMAYARRMARPFLLHRVELPLAYVLLFVVFTALLIPKNVTLLSNALRRQPETQSASGTAELMPPAEPFFWDDMNQFVDIPPSATIEISVLNGGAEQGQAATFSAILKEAGFTQVNVGNADRYDYTDARISFHPEDKPQAVVVKRLLEDTYSMIIEIPADASASGITVILGINEETQ